jgi:hypothetical protein
MLQFVLREVTDVKDDTILAISSDPRGLLGQWQLCWPGVRFFKVCAEIDRNSEDVAVVELAGDRKYAIYGTHPRPNGTFDGADDPLIVDDADQAVTTVCNYLQKFYDEYRFYDYADLIGLRCIPL